MLREQAREEKEHLYRKGRGKAGIRRALRLKVIFGTNTFISVIKTDGFLSLKGIADIRNNKITG